MIGKKKVMSIAFGRWCGSAGQWFILDRIYLLGRWTPFVWVRRRYNR